MTVKRSGPGQSAGPRSSAGDRDECADPATVPVGRRIEAQTGWSIRKFVKSARRYRTIEIQAGRQAVTAAGPLPDDLCQALDAINTARHGMH